MTKSQVRKAIEDYQQREQAEKASQRAERLTVAGYPASHNPYIPHEAVDDCFPGCVREAAMTPRERFAEEVTR